MGTNRHIEGRGRIDRKKMAKGPNGHPLCRYCFKETPSKRRTFCGPDCVHEYKIRSDSGYMRRAVFKRDGGVCSHCLLDTRELARAATAIAAGRSKWTWAVLSKAIAPLFESYGYPPPPNERPKNLKKINRYLKRSGLYWHADHIQRVDEGGGACGLDNIQTLCVPCHRDKCRIEIKLKKDRK